MRARGPNSAKGSNNVALRFGDHGTSRNKRNVGSCLFKSLTSFKRRTTTPNNTKQHTTRCAKGCCVHLHGAYY